MKGDKLTDKPASFAKLPLLISTKTPKEIKEISMFFKKSTKLTKKNTGKSYAQALSPKISKILKIKKTFPKLQANKIDNIHKIINGIGKPKPKLNIMTKSPSMKQATMYLPQGQHAMSMCPDIILFNLHHTYMHHMYTMRNYVP